LQRQILDLPEWGGGALLNLKQMGNVKGDLITFLVPHYLIKQGARWRRQPALDNPLAKIMRETLKRTRDPINEQDLAEIVRKELLLAQRDELAACVSWLADKLVEAGEAEPRLDGLVFINLDADIKQLRKDIAADQRRVKDELRQLMILRRERWVGLKDKLERIQIPNLVGRALYEALKSVRSDLLALGGEVVTAATQAEQEIDKLIEDARRRATDIERRAAKAHVIWRDVLDLGTRLRELLDAAKAVQEAQGSEKVDRYSAARDVHATFEGRYRGLSRLFDPPSDSSAREKLAALGLGREFREVSVSYSGEVL
jgi:hypothetical protein